MEFSLHLLWPVGRLEYWVFLEEPLGIVVEDSHLLVGVHRVYSVGIGGRVGMGQNRSQSSAKLNIRQMHPAPNSRLNA